MASAVQVRMLGEILKELLNQVALSARIEIASALNILTNPPAELINILCEDVVEVSGPLLEKAILSDEKLIHIIRYGTEPHRIHISRRFGLSPLVRHELEKAYEMSENSKLKYSLNELDKLAEDDVPDMDEEMTANILELLRAQKIHNHYPEHPADIPLADAPDMNKPEEKLSATVPTLFPNHPDEAEIIADQPTTNPPSDTNADSLSGKNMTDHIHSHDIFNQDNGPVFTRDVAANDAALPTDNYQQDSNIHVAGSSSDMGDDIWQQVRTTRQETNRQRDFVRTVADWFWEVDRNGLISFISEESFIVFGRSAPSLIGEDFISLCTIPQTGSDIDHKGNSLESLFEHRSSFRNTPFYISSENEEKNLWYLSAIAIFDIHTGRFTGFRGSGRVQTIESELSLPPQATSSAIVSSQQEEALEEYITTRALKAVSQDDILPAQAQEMPGQDSDREKVAEELLQNLSHEFRTPLNAIIGFSEMIDMETWGPVNKQYHKNIKNILTAAAQLKEAVNNVLDSAKLEAGLMEIAPESFSLKSVLENCQENAAALAKEFQVHLTDNNNNIDVILYNDKQSVELCLTKMLACVIKRASGGETISPSVLINSNAQVRIEIPILGARINEHDSLKIFRTLNIKSDEQGDMAPSDLVYESKISSGFGLSIAQRLANMIGGNISVHCAQGYASHLVLTLSNHDPAS